MRSRARSTGRAAADRRVVAYADTSAIVRAYMPDEPAHERVRRALFHERWTVLTSVLADVEMTAAVRAAARAGRIADPEPLLDQVAADMAPDGPLVVLGLSTEGVLGRARDLCDRHPLRALDALHIAVALVDGARVAGDAGLAFLTCDARQAEAARASGLELPLQA